MRKLKFLPSVFRVATLGLLAISAGVNAQNTITNLAGEYPVIGAQPGDQTKSDLTFNSTGGWIVWQDNAIDGVGLGIGARHLDSNLSGDFNVFRVNETIAGEQERPKVALLNNGGAAVVWQGGRPGFQKIYARFLSASGIFVSGDVMVNTYTNQHQIHPSIAALNDGNVIVTWSSFGQDGSYLGIYGQLLSATGSKIGSEFQINQATELNQRTPSVAALSNGKFVVTWGTERTRQPSAADPRNMEVKIVCRIFNANGTAAANEFHVNSDDTLCSNPSVAATTDGFVVVWARMDTQNSANSWDVFGRAYNLSGSPLATAFRVNETVVGDQYLPTLAVSGTNCLVAWTSLGQDSSFEGVYGRNVTDSGVAIGSEFLINTTTVNRQLDPAVAADNTGRFLVAWSAFVGGGRSFEIYAQRYGFDGMLTLPPPTIPYVSSLSSSSLGVTWPPLAGYAVDFYELYVDGGSTPVVVSGNQHTINNLAPSSTHSFRVLYQLTNGERSPLSGTAFGTTWGADANGDGLPDDWQASNWGSDSSAWPLASADSDGDGASNAAEFFAGTNPNDAGSVLKTRMHRGGPGMVFSWSTQPGFIYQVQRADTLGTWQNVGSPRFAHGITDSITLANAGQSSFYRVIRLR